MIHIFIIFLISIFLCLVLSHDITLKSFLISLDKTQLSTKFEKICQFLLLLFHKFFTSQFISFMKTYFKFIFEIVKVALFWLLFSFKLTNKFSSFQNFLFYMLAKMTWL